MTKSAKTRRRENRKKKERERAHKRDGSKLKPWDVPKMKYFQMPPLLKDDVPWEKRLEIVRTIGLKAKTEFDEKYPNIQRWLTDYDPLHVLSMCAFYFVSSEDGIDREAIGKLDFHHHYLEIMQAFALYAPRKFNMRPLQSNMGKLKSEMIDIGKAMSLRDLAIPETVTSEDALNTYLLRTQMMGQTTAVRNWAYQHQMRKVVLDLSAAVEAEFLEKYKINAVSFFKMIFDLVEERGDLLNTHVSKVRIIFKKKNYIEILSSYNQAFPENVPIVGTVAEDMWKMAGKNINVLRSLLIAHSDLKLESVYTFSLEHAADLLEGNAAREDLKNLLNRLSYRFGDLSDFKREHIILGNPVLSRPFIQLENEEYFTSIWGILPHLAMDILEDLVWDDPALKAKYTRIKSKYLEEELERIIRHGFPNGALHRGSRWKDPDSGVEYENDLLVVLDGFALVLEAKSASISDPARRGAPDRLASTFRELIQEPSDQAHRFIRHLESQKKIHTFNTKHGIKNIVDSSSIKYYIPLGVTLSHLGSIGSNLKKLIDAGFLDKELEQLAPSISITDLEAVFELLPLEIEKIHYFSRRREFEAHMRYEADELDLLGFYLDTGFNIGPKEYDESTAINMLLKSKELDPYFIGSREGKNITKPQLSLTKWWRDILNRISETKNEGWIETGFILLNTAKEDQEKFEREFKALCGRIKRGDVSMPHNFVILKSGPVRRQYVIVGYPCTTEDRDIRNSVIDEIVHGEDAEGSRGVAVIGMNLLYPNYPYSFLARKIATDLFDELTLREEKNENS